MTKNRLAAFARGGMLVLLLTLGVALILSAWANRQGVDHISTVLDRGQAERFFHSFPLLHDRNQGPATAADLRAVLAQYQDQGLKYLVEYDQAGNLVAEAGEHAGIARPVPDRVSAEPVLIGERVQVTFRPPGQRVHSGAHSLPLPLPNLVMEFEPRVANELRLRATRDFAFSTAAAVALVALTLGLWLALRREERDRARSERERHLTALGEMSAVLAHEIRNPLASLKGHAQLLGEQLDAGSPLQKKVDRIVGEAKRLEELTHTLLDLVRSSSVSRTVTDPVRLVREAAESLDGARIRVQAERAPSSWPLDTLRMDQVLKNLLANALQASDDQGPVEASVSQEGGRLVIRVRDHGAGLEVGSEDRLFEPFHSTRVNGTGLGLAIARRIVELHGGQIHGQNHPSGGALFTLSIPN